MKETIEEFIERKNTALTFNKEEDGHWYVYLPKYPLSHHNLMMVAGADELCEKLSDDGKQLKIEIVTGDKDFLKEKGFTKLSRTKWSLFGGADYDIDKIEGLSKIWLCPVTLYVFNRYPSNIYIKKCDKDFLEHNLYKFSFEI